MNSRLAFGPKALAAISDSQIINYHFLWHQENQKHFVWKIMFWNKKEGSEKFWRTARRDDEDASSVRQAWRCARCACLAQLIAMLVWTRLYDNAPYVEDALVVGRLLIPGRAESWGPRKNWRPGPRLRQEHIALLAAQTS